MSDSSPHNLDVFASIFMTDEAQGTTHSQNPATEKNKNENEDLIITSTKQQNQSNALERLKRLRKKKLEQNKNQLDMGCLSDNDDDALYVGLEARIRRRNARLENGIETATNMHDDMSPQPSTSRDRKHSSKCKNVTCISLSSDSEPELPLFNFKGSNVKELKMNKSSNQDDDFDFPIITESDKVKSQFPQPNNLGENLHKRSCRTSDCTCSGDSDSFCFPVSPRKSKRRKLKHSTKNSKNNRQADVRNSSLRSGSRKNPSVSATATSTVVDPVGEHTPNSSVCSSTSTNGAMSHNRLTDDSFTRNFGLDTSARNQLLNESGISGNSSLNSPTTSRLSNEVELSAIDSRNVSLESHSTTLSSRRLELGENVSRDLSLDSQSANLLSSGSELDAGGLRNMSLESPPGYRLSNGTGLTDSALRNIGLDTPTRNQILNEPTGGISINSGLDLAARNQLSNRSSLTDSALRNIGLDTPTRCQLLMDDSFGRSPPRSSDSVEIISGPTRVPPRMSRAVSSRASRSRAPRTAGNLDSVGGSSMSPRYRRFRKRRQLVGRTPSYSSDEGNWRMPSPEVIPIDNDESDEAMARRLQEEMDREFAASLQSQPSESPMPNVYPGLPALHMYHGFPSVNMFHGNHPVNFNPVVLGNLLHSSPIDGAVSHRTTRSRRPQGRRQNNRRRRIESDYMSSPGNDYEELLQLAERLGDVKEKGLSQQMIDRLPTRTYTKLSTNGSTEEEPLCHVCFSEFESGECVRMLTCLHEFHKDCIDKWIKGNATCPICRLQVEVF